MILRIIENEPFAANDLSCILLNFIVIGWVFFRADSMHYTLSYIGNMFGFVEVAKGVAVYAFEYYIDTIEVLTFIAAILRSMPLFKDMLYVQNRIAKTFVNAWLLIMFVLSTISIAAGTYNPFIYFRF